MRRRRRWPKVVQVGVWVQSGAGAACAWSGTWAGRRVAACGHWRHCCASRAWLWRARPAGRRAWPRAGRTLEQANRVRGPKCVWIRQQAGEVAATGEHKHRCERKNKSKHLETVWEVARSLSLCGAKRGKDLEAAPMCHAKCSHWKSSWTHNERRPTLRAAGLCKHRPEAGKTALRREADESISRLADHHHSSVRPFRRPANWVTGSSSIFVGCKNESVCFQFELARSQWACLGSESSREARDGSEACANARAARARPLCAAPGERCKGACALRHCSLRACPRAIVANTSRCGKARRGRRRVNSVLAKSVGSQRCESVWAQILQH